MRKQENGEGRGEEEERGQAKRAGGGWSRGSKGGIRSHDKKKEDEDVVTKEEKQNRGDAGLSIAPEVSKITSTTNTSPEPSLSRARHASPATQSAQ